jgi:acetylornithine deacetylase
MSEVAELLADLVRLPSVNPCGCEPEGPYQGEERMTRFVHEWLQERGIACRRQSVSPGRENVIARVPGREEPPIVFESHMDTVGVDGMTVAPFEPRIEDGRMFGRGSCDTKSSLAAMMIALARVAQGDPPPRTVELVAVVDEEYLHGGVARYLEDSGPVHCAVVGEPSKLRVVVAHKGALRTRVTTRGVSAHSSSPDNGVNAIYRMARAVLALEQLADSLRERTAHPLVGKPTLSVGTIAGGMAVNIVPELCQIMVDRRLIPGETPDGAFGEIAAALDGILEPGDDLTPTLKDWPVETDRDAAIVEIVRSAVRAIGGEDEPEGVPYCTDGCDFAERGVPLVVFGPGDIAQAHTAGEWVEIAQVEAAVDAYEQMMRG